MPSKMLVLIPVAKYRHPLNISSLEDVAHIAEIMKVEAYNNSEVSRARQIVATRAYRLMKKEPYDLVLWLDADMVIFPDQFKKHIECVEALNMCISGRYAMRQKNRSAASHDGNRNILMEGKWTLHPVYSGLGCLLMPASIFKAQVESCPYSGKSEDDPDGMNLICAPRIEKAIDGTWGMISEDYDYCRSLDVHGGVWYAHDNESFINYGHIGEKTLLPEAGTVMNIKPF